MGHQLAIASISMGWHPSHTLEQKIRAAKKSGFEGIELVHSDLDKYAQNHQITHLAAASEVRKLCQEAGVEIICLASFDNFEGEPTPLEGRLRTATEWIELAHHLGTDVIQIPSNDSKGAVGDEEVIVAELRAIAELGSRQEPPVSFAYEALAWGTHVADWEESLRIVQLLDRPNFGLCLDTYHVLARIWADPRSHSGVRPGGAAALRDTVQRFRDLCPPENVIYVQLSDAEKLDPPILPGHPVYSELKDGTHSWCMFGRLFPLEGEKGAYFPMEDILRAWLQDTDWSGWVSMEVFHREMAEESLGPDTWAERGRRSWERVGQLLRAAESSK